MNHHDSTIFRRMGLQICVFVLLSCTGCGTTINRVATEQLLLSDAIDSAVNQIDFSHFRGQSCYLDTSYLKQNQKTGIINTEYVVSSLRQQIVTAGALLQEKRADAEIVIEPRVGALGTDGHEIVYGVPQGGSIAGAATAFSSTPIPVPAIPEIAFGKNDSQSGIAKISVFAYERTTRQPVWQSGIAKAESTSNNTWVLGAGPFQKGSVYEGIRFAGRKLPDRTGLLEDEHQASTYEVERHFPKTAESQRLSADTTEAPDQSEALPSNPDTTTESSSVRLVNHEEALPVSNDFQPARSLQSLK